MLHLGEAWKCEGCNSVVTHTKPWNCPGCGKEVCGNCFEMYALCKPCTGNKTDEEAKALAIANGWDFKD